MSHFSVLVIGPDHETQLAPYHEFECTGTVDQYVVDVDETEERQKSFAEHTEPMVRLADGTEVSRYDNSMYREPTAEEKASVGPFGGSGWSGGVRYESRDWGDGQGYRTKIHAVPADAVEFQQGGQSVADWAEYHGVKLLQHGEQPDLEGDHKFGYVQLDESGAIVKAVRRTNPNAKWDWWVAGGRWSGYLKLRDGADGALGNPGTMGACFDRGAGRADQALKGAIDFDGMRNAAGTKAAERWDKAAAAKVAAGFPADAEWISWKQMREDVHKGDIDAARKAYHEQAAMTAVAKAFDDPFGDTDEFMKPRQQFIQAARDRSVTTYALLQNGQWFAKGDMGWWGCSTDAMTQDEWNRKFNELLDSLPDDTLLTVVDCHI